MNTRPHFKHWPKRVPQHIPFPQTTLWHNLETSAQRYPDKAAVVFLGATLTYAQLKDRVLRMAAYLHGLGVGPGDRVVLCMQNCPQLIVTHFAILRLGAVVVPVNPMNKCEELKHYIVDPDTQVAVTTADLAQELASASNALAPQLRLAHLVVTHLSEAWESAVEMASVEAVAKAGASAGAGAGGANVDAVNGVATNPVATNVTAASMAGAGADVDTPSAAAMPLDPPSDPPSTLGVDDLPPSWRAWLLARHAQPELLARAGLPCSRVHCWAQAMAVRAEALAALPAHTTSPLDLAVLPYTSGTTGLPKGCEHTHRSIMYNALSSGIWGNGSAAAVSLLVVPMFHITGMVSVMHTGIQLGATLVVMPRWDREVAGRLIAQHRVTHWTNIPTMVMDLLASPRVAEYDLSSLVNIGGGGAAMPQAVAQRLLDTYGLVYVEGYGLTETAAPSHTNPPDRAKQQCLGVPYIGVDARVWNVQTGQECAPGEEGEIIIHGPQVFRAYWKRADATAQAFIEFEGKRFFRSGDIGRMDEEGYFFMTDRLKRMINASGFKVWPAEVEALMFKHEAIAEACVVASHDAYRGETVKAFVVLRQSHVGQVSESDIITWCRATMAVYKAPTRVEFVTALPKSGSGKTMWRALQEAELAKARAPSPSPQAVRPEPHVPSRSP